MLFKPTKAMETLRKAVSTKFINYAEITLRIIPAVALILAADVSKYPDIFKKFDLFMPGTSILLYFVPRTIYHNFSTKAADILKQRYFQLLSTFRLDNWHPDYLPFYLINMPMLRNHYQN